MNGNSGAGGWPVLEVNSARPGGFNGSGRVGEGGATRSPEGTALDAETGVSLFDATVDTCRYHIGPVFGKILVTI